MEKQKLPKQIFIDVQADEIVYQLDPAVKSIKKRSNHKIKAIEA